MPRLLAGKYPNTDVQILMNILPGALERFPPAKSPLYAPFFTSHPPASPPRRQIHPTSSKFIAHRTLGGGIIKAAVQGILDKFVDDRGVPLDFPQHDVNVSIHSIPYLLSAINFRVI